MIELPGGFMLADVPGGLGRWCLRWHGDAWTLCGRTDYRVPAAGFVPDPDDEVHDVCLAAMAELTRVEVGPSGVCPACGEMVPLVGGRIGSHGRCVGTNMAPKGAR